MNVSYYNLNIFSDFSSNTVLPGWISMYSFCVLILRKEIANFRFVFCNKLFIHLFTNVLNIYILLYYIDIYNTQGPSFYIAATLKMLAFIFLSSQGLCRHMAGVQGVLPSILNVWDKC